jgi:uncharacterized membrane protein (DUF485 family)
MNTGLSQIYMEQNRTKAHVSELNSTKKILKEKIMSVLIASNIQKNPKYLELVHRRNTLGWTLSAIVCVMYFGFTLMIAYAPDILTNPIAPDSVIPMGMLIGLGVIVASCATTGIYVYMANKTFDPIIEEIVREASK